MRTIAILSLLFLAACGQVETPPPNPDGGTVPDPVRLANTVTLSGSYLASTSPTPYTLSQVAYEYSDGSVQTNCEVVHGSDDVHAMQMYSSAERARVGYDCAVDLDGTWDFNAGTVRYTVGKVTAQILLSIQETQP